MTIGYQSHADTATKSGSTTKNKFVVWESPYVPLFIFLSYFVVGAHVYFAAKDSAECNLEGNKEFMPNVAITCPGTYTINAMENRWMQKLPQTLIMRGINSGCHLECFILY